MFATAILGKMYRTAQQQIRRVRNISAMVSKDQFIHGAWYPSRNWGDALSPFLMEAISGHKAIHYLDVFHTKGKPVYSVIGSVLGSYPAPNLIVWGSGFISSERTLVKKPSLITAVRGPRSRQKLIDLGLKCPKVYGDPALLLPRFLRPREGNMRYKLGIVPHYVDQTNPMLQKFKDNEDVLIIDICSGISEVVDAICSCDVIASSSLHGIICADAYGIPSVWLEFSDKVVGSGFKFVDYFESVGRFGESPLVITSRTSTREIYSCPPVSG